MLARSLLVGLITLLGASAQNMRDLSLPKTLPPDSTLVLGFLGGFERWNDDHRGVRKLVLKLRAEHGIYAASIGNHNRKVALKYIKRAVKQGRHARIILFGQSWGGAAAVYTARDLDKLGIPVLLTVQVDSVGARDGVIPPNVAAALNFFQHDPLTFQGRREIRAADPVRTRILGNFGFTYLFTSVQSADASWARRKLGGGHAKMEMDPETWARVESYIREAISRK